MFRVLSYNMWGKFGPYDQRYGNLLKAVTEIDADIYCFQEAGDIKLLREIARITGLRLLMSDVDETGLAILRDKGSTRKGLVKYDARSPFEGYIRKYQWAEIRDRSGKFLVVNTHLSWKEGDDFTRQGQVEELHRFLERKKMPLILCGDFNCDFHSGPMTKLRDGGLTDTMLGMPDENAPTWDNQNPFIQTHPAKFPDRRIDLILADDPFLKHHPLVHSSIVLNQKGPDQMYPSDHYGVLAEFAP